MSKAQITKLGIRIDGWADLIDNAGDQVDTLYQFLRVRLGQRKMPQVKHYPQKLSTGRLMGEERQYHMVSHQVGSTVAVYIGAFGEDLYLSWDLFAKQAWKRRVFFIIMGVAAVLSLLVQLFSEDSYPVIMWLSGTIGGTLGICILVALAGLVLRGNFWAFFQEEFNHFRADDLAAMTLAVHHSLLEGLDSIGVDRDLIRPKEQFRAGRRERII